MPAILKKYRVRNQARRKGALRIGAPICLMRCLCAGLMLLGPAAMMSSVSCGLNCSAKCEERSVARGCIELSSANCLDGGVSYPCALGIGCHCADTKPTPSCAYACSIAADRATCAAKTGCEWGDACRDLIDCHSLGVQSACEANGRQCHWSKNCG